ncbi:MAG: motB1 [Paucimonas sp.]|jgi:chemotaxis protein MotB|nr:motB1 [Paucimonas sp.]
MARRKRFEEEHENHERWLVSYADFITLLFAFFVVMYAISSLNEGKYRVLANALGTAFGRVDAATLPSLPNIRPPVVQELGKPMLTAKQRAAEAALKREKEHLTRMANDVLKALAPLVRQGKVRVTQNNRGISIEINASVLFAPGAAKLSPESEQALRAVAQVLKDDHHAMQIEGHTDNVPISTAVFPSNWELSSVRASSVVRLFADSGIAERRMVAMGHGANQPIAPNDNAEGRMRNRRVTVMILSELPDDVIELPFEKPEKEKSVEKNEGRNEVQQNASPSNGNS